MSIARLTESLFPLFTSLSVVMEEVECVYV